MIDSPKPPKYYTLLNIKPAKIHNNVTWRNIYNINQSMERNWIPQSQYIYVLSLYLFLSGPKMELTINEKVNLQCKRGLWVEYIQTKGHKKPRILSQSYTDVFPTPTNIQIWIKSLCRQLKSWGHFIPWKTSWNCKPIL